jgi:hypothetical protein
MLWIDETIAILEVLLRGRLRVLNIEFGEEF